MCCMASRLRSVKLLGIDYSTLIFGLESKCYYASKRPKKSWYMYAIFELAKGSSLFAFMADIVCSPESAFPKIQNDNLLVCEMSRIVVDLIAKVWFCWRVILMVMINR